MIRDRAYSELSRLETFEERFRYLKMDGIVGQETFGFDRVFNQMFYRSAEWKFVRDRIIVRDGGCDLGVDDRMIFGRIVIHHINPISMADIERNRRFLLDPENLITTTLDTHNAIHYGDEGLLITLPVARSKYDTCPWKSL